MTVTLDSLMITNGNGTDPSSEGFTGGGGIQNNTGNNVGAALTVKNSIISGNTVSGNGGGILNRDGSTLTIINSTIFGNSPPAAEAASTAMANCWRSWTARSPAIHPASSPLAIAKAAGVSATATT